MLELYANIKKIREARGMSQDELAKLVGFKSRSSINKIELGVNDITQSKLVAIAKALHVSVSELMGDDKQIEPLSPTPDTAYYNDPEVAAIANEMKENPGMRVLLDASRGLKKESLEEVRKFIEFQKAKELGDYDG